MTDTMTVDAEAGECDDTLRLDNQLCFGLYAAAHAMSRAYKLLLGELGLTYPQYLVMLTLWEGDRRNVSELGSRLKLDSGTLTPILKRLEAANLLTRKRSRSDEREVEIALTDLGRSMRKTAVGVRADIVCKLGMSEGEIRRMREDLNSVIDRLGQATE